MTKRDRELRTSNWCNTVNLAHYYYYYYYYYLTFVRPKHEYASIVWNSVTSTTDTKKMEGIQHKPIAQCQNLFFLMATILLKRISLNWKFTLCTTHNSPLIYHFSCMFIQYKILQSLLDITGIRALCNFTNSPTVRCISAAVCAKTSTSLGNLLLL